MGNECPCYDANMDRDLGSSPSSRVEVIEVIGANLNVSYKLEDEHKYKGMIYHAWLSTPLHSKPGMHIIHLESK